MNRASWTSVINKYLSDGQGPEPLQKSTVIASLFGLSLSLLFTLIKYLSFIHYYTYFLGHSRVYLCTTVDYINRVSSLLCKQTQCLVNYSYQTEVFGLAAAGYIMPVPLSLEMRMTDMFTSILAFAIFPGSLQNSQITNYIKGRDSQ